MLVEYLRVAVGVVGILGLLILLILISNASCSEYLKLRQQPYLVCCMNPKAKGNIRDYAELPQLIIIANLETLNAEFIKQGIPQAERLQLLRSSAATQLRSILSTASIKRLEKELPK